ncbi:MAG: helix-turn-helix domain-containing protein [Fimbriimonadaceae bacterium]|nr:helix-turn-helix domain-containing protein [Fimbriimonadaceae bacterium]
MPDIYCRFPVVNFSDVGPVTGYGERIRKLRLARGWSRQALADLMSVSEDTVRAWESERVQLWREKHDEVVERLAHHLGSTASGLMMPPSESSSSLTPKTGSVSPLGERGMVPAAGRAAFPILGSVGAAAAPLRSADADPDDFVEFSERLFRPERFAVRVSGHSGGDEIHHGDFLLVQPEEVPRHGFVTVLGRSDEFVVKVAVRAQDSSFSFEAFDPEYPTIEVDGEWHMVGYVCGISREARRGRYSEEGDDGGFTARKKADGRWVIE